jgi:type I pantothenate kinase
VPGGGEIPDPVLAPLASLLELGAEDAGRRRAAAAAYLGVEPRPTPYVIGVVGSVSVGKSTLAAALRGLVGADVEVVSTDSFLLTNADLAERGIEDRKGFPESYDWDALLAFLAALRDGGRGIEVPVYSHVRYDIEPDRRQRLDGAAIVVVEGLNLLQTPPRSSGGPLPSDLLDVSLYLDAAEPDIRRWYVERFLGLRATVFSEPDSHFTLFAGLSDREATATAEGIWDAINRPNLIDHIEPTRERADIVLVKGPDHRLAEVHLRDA